MGGHRRAVEERRVGPAVQPDGVVASEVTELAPGEVAVLDELPRLGQRLGRVADVPVADVGPEDRLATPVARKSSTSAGGCSDCVAIVARTAGSSKRPPP